MSECLVTDCTNSISPRAKWCDRHKSKKGLRTRTCIVCGKLDRVHSRTLDFDTCSSCRSDYRLQKLLGVKIANIAAAKRSKALKKIQKSAEGSRGNTRIAAGPCATCGSNFLAKEFNKTPKFCSRECGKRYARSARRGHGSYPSWFDLCSDEVPDCWICLTPVDPSDFVLEGPVFTAGNFYPSVDHVVPLSRGGSNGMENLRVAHMICNSVKGNELHPILGVARDPLST
jgi:hypothetical protein